MKQIFILLMVAMYVTMFTACSKDDETAPLNPDLEEPKQDSNNDTTKYWTITLNIRISDITNDNNRCFVEFDWKALVDSVDWGTGFGYEPFTRMLNANGDNNLYGKKGIYTIKLKGHGAVKKFDCESGRKHVTSIDISQCAETLEELKCNRNLLTSLDLSKCIVLKRLECYGNQLTSLDISKNTALTWLNHSSNNLSSLDISKNTHLDTLECGGNNLTALDISKNTELRYLGCNSNNLSSTALNEIFRDLSQGKTWIDEYGNTMQTIIRVGNNPGTETCDKSIAENKGWDVRIY